MAQAPSSGADRVRHALAARGIEARIVSFADATRTSAEAAAAIGCTVAQIAKSLVFRGLASGNPILVMTSGANRVSESALAALAGEAVGKADAAFVRQKTGFAIGGVAPVGHAEPIRTFIDEDLLGFPEIWAAAGTPNAVFRLTPAELVAITGGQVAAIR